MKKSVGGFTIVELLIVIVVIAILAAISIVAYNGIQQRARASAAQLLVAQASKKVLAYFALQDNYPADLATAEITDSTKLQYSVDNNAVPKKYCLTATEATVSYYISSTQPTPKSGGCIGHTGGPAIITNLAINPSFESSLSGWGATYPTGQPAIIRVTSGIGITNGTAAIEQDIGTANAWGFQANVPNLAPSTQYTMGADVTLVSGDPTSLAMRVGDGGGTKTAVSLTPIVAGQTKRITATWTSSASVGNSSFTFWRAGTSTGIATVRVDSLLIQTGATANVYADGNSPNWSWSGTVNTSTSSGPAL